MSKAKTKQTRQNTKTNFSTEDFVQAWVDSSSYEEIAQKFNVSKRYVASRAFTLRKAGVQLPTFRAPKLNKEKIAGLNAIIAKGKKDAKN